MTQHLKKRPILGAKQILNLTWMKIKEWIGHNAHDGTTTLATLYMSPTTISQTSIDIKARISNYIHIKQWDVITQPCPIFNDGNMSENATSQDLMLRRPDAIFYYTKSYRWLKLRRLTIRSRESSSLKLSDHSLANTELAELGIGEDHSSPGKPDSDEEPGMKPDSLNVNIAYDKYKQSHWAGLEYWKQTLNGVHRGGGGGGELRS